MAAYGQRSITDTSAHAGIQTTDKADRGRASTADGLIFGGSDKSYLFALDSATLGSVGKKSGRADFRANPITHVVDGKQYVSLAAGNGIVLI